MIQQPGLYVRNLLRAILICIIEFFVHFFSEDVLAFLADENHLQGLLDIVIFLFTVALWAIVPFLAAGCPDSDLGVEDMFTHFSSLLNSNIT
jgi:exosortase/archaeosortase